MSLLASLSGAPILWLVFGLVALGVATAGYAVTMKRGSASLLENTAERQAVAGVDSKTVATTTIFTTTSGLGSFCVTAIVIQVTAASAEPDTPQATVSAGTAAGGDADIIPATSISTTLAVDDIVILRPDPANQCTVVPASTALRFAVTVGTVSTGTLTYKVHALGFYTGS